MGSRAIYIFIVYKILISISGHIDEIWITAPRGSNVSCT